eukprot:scaffold203_cov386-Prasinococcus_capsulatus_cf.AAC.23
MSSENSIGIVAHKVLYAEEPPTAKTFQTLEGQLSLMAQGQVEAGTVHVLFHDVLHRGPLVMIVVFKEALDSAYVHDLHEVTLQW